MQIKYSLKFAARTQVILLFLSLAFSILFWFSACVGKGLGDKDFLIDMDPLFKYLSFCIIIVLVLKLIFLKNNYILPIGGGIVFIGFMLCERIKYLNYLNYCPSNLSTPDYFHLSTLGGAIIYCF